MTEEERIRLALGMVYRTLMVTANEIGAIDLPCAPSQADAVRGSANALHDSTDSIIQAVMSQ